MVSIVQLSCLVGLVAQLSEHYGVHGFEGTCSQNSVCPTENKKSEPPYIPVCSNKVPVEDTFCDETLPAEVRASKAVAAVSTDNKPTQLMGNTTEIPQVALNMMYRGHAEHGVAGVGYTVFPIPPAMAATFNSDLFLKIATTVSTEGRAMYNSKYYEDTAIFEDKGSVHRPGRGAMSWFDPFINLFIDPRWGRGQEAPGEDPFLASEYAKQFVKGYQGHPGDPLYDSRCQKSIATCKSFVAYGMENGDGTDRYHVNVEVDNYDLQHTHYPMFKACIDAGVSSILCAYNAINGVPACATPLIHQVLRDEFNFTGFVISDVGAVERIYDAHHYTDSYEETAQVALQAGLDIDSNDTTYRDYLGRALDNKLITIEQLDTAVQRTYTERMKTGEWDVNGCRYDSLSNKTDVHTPENVALSLQTARESIVLLKNRNNLLPLSKSSRVAVVGPNANATDTLLGVYHGIPLDGDIISPLNGIATKVAPCNLFYTAGCGDVCCQTDDLFSDAIEEAHKADVVIAVLGLQPITHEGENHPCILEGEMSDRVSLELPGKQNELVKRIIEETKTPVVAVLVNGGPLAIEWLKDNADAIIEAWYGGEQGGMAIADVLFGDYNPGGRLPVTFYPASYVDEVKLTDMRMRPEGSYPGRTHRYYTGTPIYPFGHGLSYTQFEFIGCTDKSSVQHAISGEPFTMPLCVLAENIGDVAGDVVIMATAEAEVTAETDPKVFKEKSLFGFSRIHLRPHERQTVEFQYNLPLNVKPKSRVEITVADRRYDILVDFEPLFDPQKVKLGIQAINWINEDFKNLGETIPIEQCLSEVALSQFHYTELNYKMPTNAIALDKLLAPRNVHIAASWQCTFFTEGLKDKTIADFKHTMQFLKMLGGISVNVAECSRSVQGFKNIPVFAGKPVMNDNEWQLLADGLNEVGRIAKEHGMRVAYHQHLGTVVETNEELERLMNMTDPEVVGLCADTGHFYSAGINVNEVFRKYAHRINHVHLKNIRKWKLDYVKKYKLSFYDAIEFGVFTVPGSVEGTAFIDFIEVFEELQKSGYEGYVMIEADENPYKVDPLEQAIIARQYLRMTTGL